MNHRSDARPPAPRPQRRRVSRQRYLVRRVGVVAVVGLGVFGVVKVAVALTGDDGGPVAEGTGTGTGTPAGTGSGAGAGTAAPGVTDPTVVAPQVVASTAVASTESAPPATEAPEETGPPAEDSPASLLVVGDSDAGTFGPYLEQLMDDTGIVDTEVDYKVSSGLSRPDFFDWPDHVRSKLEDEDPDIVVVTFGGNDAQGMATVDGEFPTDWADPVGSRDTWFPEYRRRVGEFVDLLLADPDRTVIWVGIPNDNNPVVTKRLEVQDEAVRSALESRPRVIFVDTWRRFSGHDGNWAEFVIDPRDGQGKAVRASDGFHLNENGAEILALDIATVIRDDLEARGADV
jgi:uncharacterized protein